MILRNVRRSRRLSSGSSKRSMSDKEAPATEEEGADDDIDQLHQDIFGSNFM